MKNISICLQVKTVFKDINLTMSLSLSPNMRLFL